MISNPRALPPFAPGSFCARMAPVAIAAALAGLVAVYAALPHLAAVFVQMPRAERTIAAMARDADLIRAIEAQNAALAGQAQAGIDAADADWIAQKRAGGGPAIDALLNAPASQRLRVLMAAGEGTLRGAILMDDRGRNVAVTHPTSDYWQGDEAKWLETFARGPAARHRSGHERGHDGEGVVCWVSVTVANDAGRPVGALAVELDYGLVGGHGCGR